MLWRIWLSQYWIYLPYPQNSRMSELVFSPIVTLFILFYFIIATKPHKSNVFSVQNRIIYIYSEIISSKFCVPFDYAELSRRKILEMKQICLFFFCQKFCITLFTDSFLHVMLWRVWLSQYWIYLPYPQIQNVRIRVFTHSNMILLL